jgi:hypothetical protein
MKLSKKFITISVIGLCLSQNIFAGGRLSVMHKERLNNPVNEQVLDNFLEVKFKGKKEKDKKWDGYYSVEGRFYPGQDNNTILSMSEFYIQRNYKQLSITAGRKILDWNSNEKFWGLGVLNANRGFSYMDFKREGISAIHLQARIKNFGIHFFASALHIPQMNPTFQITDRKVTAVNEWSALPFSEVLFNGTSIPLYNELQKPDPKDFLFNTSVGLNTSYRWKSGKAQIFGTYKPENLPRIVATGIYDPASEAAEVKAAAFSNKHLVWGGNVSQKIKNATIVAGMIVDHPDVGKLDSFEFEAMRIVPSYKRRTYAHASVHFKNKYYQFSLNYLQTFEGPTGLGNAFSKKPLWKQAVGAKLAIALSSKFSILTFSKYDLELKDSIMSLNVNYNLTKHMKLTLGIETIDAPESISFWSPFKTNDSITSEMSYKF